jgi:hypothetical protein
MSTEFDKNISDWRYDCTDLKNGFDFFMRLVNWPKIAFKKCQNLIFIVNFQRQKSFKSFYKIFSLNNINLGAHVFFLLILCSIKIEQLLFLKFLKILAFFWQLFLAILQVWGKNQGHFCNQCNHAFNLKWFYPIPLPWWKTCARLCGL